MTIFDRFLFLFQTSDFNMEDAIYALVFTVLILGGLLIVEAIHKPLPRRSRRPERRAQELIPPVVSPIDTAVEAPSPPTPSAAASVASPSTLTTDSSLSISKPSVFKETRWLWAMFAGFASTLIMSGAYGLIALNSAPTAPRVDPPADLAMFLSNQTGSEIGMTMGWLLHLMMGVVLGILYALGFANRFTNRPLFFRGLLFGFIVWVALGLVMMPVMGAGAFASNMGDAQGTILTVSLIGHIVFGIVLSWIYRGRRDEK